MAWIAIQNRLPTVSQRRYGETLFRSYCRCNTQVIGMRLCALSMIKRGRRFTCSCSDTFFKPHSQPFGTKGMGDNMVRNLMPLQC
ncbi:unnamed protein product [Brassica rapa subsp. narinosa]